MAHVLQSLLLPLLSLLHATSAFTPHFEHAGALVGSSLESSPVFYRGRLLLMQSMMGSFAPDGRPHGFFCVFDAATGEKLACPESSSGHAFCSAIVDATPGREETLWVFCSAWDRANHDCPTPGWGCGACATPGDCYVGSWRCSVASLADCGDWGFARALALPHNLTVPNVGVGLVPASASPPAGVAQHQAFMALEMAISVAINTGSDGDLSQSWQLLDPAAFAVEGVGNSGLCPFARYDPSSAHYYVGGGGEHINLMRSATLTKGSWEAPRDGVRAIEQGCTELLEDCSPGSPVARIADGFYTG